MLLKVKDNVDLKELEKYGFKKKDDFYIREYEKDNRFSITSFIRIRCLSNYAYYKEIQNCAKDKLGFVSSSYDCEDKVQDLIKADLIEKGRR